MKVKCEMTINLDNGEYEVKFINLHKPGEDIEYDTALLMIKNIIDELTENAQKEDDPQVTKIIH
jgi:hypothetical protein